MTDPPVGSELSPDHSGDELDLLAAALRADATDLEIYARVLTTSLSDALPSGMVSLEHQRSMGDRLAGRSGQVRQIRVDLGDVVLSLRQERAGVPEATIARSVRGVVISSKEVNLDQWTRTLAAAMTERARQSSSARAALAKLLGA